MTLRRALCMAIMATAVCVPTASAEILIDFDGLTTGTVYPSYTENGATFATVTGGGLRGYLGPNGTPGILGEVYDPYYEELRADLAVAAASVTVDLGDDNGDSDRLFLEIFDASDVSLGYTDLVIPWDFTGMKTLSLSAPDIAYAVFGAREAVTGSSVVADNFRFEPIPAPAAAVLGIIGLGMVGWVRRRSV
jgi:hypothetical protein